MSGKTVKKIIFAVFVMGIIFLNKTSAYAYDAKVSVSTGTVEENEKVTITVKITSESEIGVSQVWLKYDKSVVSYYDGGDSEGDTGLVRLFDSIDSGSSKEIIRTVTFVGKNPGETVITVTDDSEILEYTSEDDMSITTTPGKITVTAPAVASGDNTLKSINIYGINTDGKSSKLTFKPGFSGDTTEYAIDVSADIEKLSVVATTSHNKAKVKISGLKLSTGDNVTTITVTAENGDSKKYFIYTKKEKGEEETTKEPEGKDNPDLTDKYIEITINDKKMNILKEIDESILPEGFEVTDMTYGETSINAGKGLSKNLVIIYILDENKENGALYIYDDKNNKFYPMVNILTGNKMYTIVNTPEEFNIPEGFVSTTISIDGKETSAWSYGDISDFVYLYAMNWDGECAIYCYDTVEKTIQRVSEYKNSSSSNAKIAELESKNNELNNQLKNSNDKNNKSRKMIIFLSIVIVVFAAVTVSMIIIFGKKGNIPENLKNVDDNDETDNDEADNDKDDETDSDNESEKDISEEELTKDNVSINSDKEQTNTGDEKKSLTENLSQASENEKTVNTLDEKSENAYNEEKEVIMDKAETEKIIDSLLNFNVDDFNIEK